MKEVCFQRILIADIEKKAAHVESFVKGLNVVTSKDNHVGKSSLLKSLYYTMGAEVQFDKTWHKDSKLCVVSFAVDDDKYRIVRWRKRFAVFHNGTLIKLTDHVARELAPLMEDIFGFAVYLPNKQTQKVEIAPPAFVYMPYYIDQDLGWKGLYESFESIDQYQKSERIKSLYYHLNIYTKSTVELMAKRDRLKERQEALQDECTRLTTILTALNGEIKNLPAADTYEELEKNLQIPKDRITKMVGEIGKTRNLIQSIETTLHQHRYQLDVIRTHISSQKGEDENSHNSVFVCPNCGYIPNEEIFNMVKENYGTVNEGYICQQIELLIATISEKLRIAKEQYIVQMATLREEEKAFKAEQDEFDVYVRQRGLQDSIRRFQEQLGAVCSEDADIIIALKGIEKELRKLPNKKEVEEKYIEFARLNIMQLSAWDASYDNNIHLLKPIKAQGTLENKIILAQFIALYQTMAYFQSSATRFPFVIDSPRGNEASAASSKEILKLITEVDMLPQIILATIDYNEFAQDLPSPAKMITLTEQRKLLSSEIYESHSEEIEELLELLKKA